MARNKRRPRGVYTLTPPDKPCYSEVIKQPFWEVDGTTKVGERIHGRRFDSHEKARAFRNTLEEADKEAKPGAEIIVLDFLNQAECRDAIRAYAQFPRGSDGKADPRYKLEDSARFAMEMGFNPQWMDWELEPLIKGKDGFLEDIQRRGSLPRNAVGRISSARRDNLLYSTGVMLKLFENTTLPKFLDPLHQELVISKRVPKEHMARNICDAVSSIRTWLNKFHRVPSKPSYMVSIRRWELYYHATW